MVMVMIDWIYNFFEIYRWTQSPTLTLLNVAAIYLASGARAVSASQSRCGTVTPPLPLLFSMPACCVATAHALPCTPLAINNN